MKKQIDIYMKQGFTLIEVIMICVLLGVLAIIAIPSLSNTIANSKQAVCTENRQRLMMAIQGDISKRVADGWAAQEDDGELPDISTLLERYQKTYELACPSGEQWRLREEGEEWHLDCEACGGRTIVTAILADSRETEEAAEVPMPPPGHTIGPEATDPEEEQTTAAASSVTKYVIRYWLDKPEIPMEMIEQMKAGGAVEAAYFDVAHTEMTLVDNEKGESFRLEKIIQNHEQMGDLEWFPFSTYYMATVPAAGIENETIVADVYYLRNIYTMNFVITNMSPTHIMETKNSGDYVSWEILADGDAEYLYCSFPVKLGMDITSNFPDAVVGEGAPLMYIENDDSKVFKGWGLQEIAVGGVVDSSCFSTDPEHGWADYYDEANRSAVFFDRWSADETV